MAQGHKHVAFNEIGRLHESFKDQIHVIAGDCAIKRSGLRDEVRNHCSTVVAHSYLLSLRFCYKRYFEHETYYSSNAVVMLCDITK